MNAGMPATYGPNRISGLALPVLGSNQTAVASDADSREFSEATELYSRLSKELVTRLKTDAAYETRFLGVNAARERCERARHVLKTAKDQAGYESVLNFLWVTPNLPA
jgi:hypothetical protein